MSETPKRRSLIGPYPIWAMCLVPVIFAALFVLGMWLGRNRKLIGLALPTRGYLPPEWAVVFVVMIAILALFVAYQEGYSRTLVQSPAFFGGLLIFTAGFFNYGHAAWGSGLSLYGLLTGHIPLARGRVLLFTWPMPFGVLLSSLTYATIALKRRWLYRCHWIILGLLLVAIAAARAVLIYQEGLWSDQTIRTVMLFRECLAVICIAIAFVCVRGDKPKVSWVELIAGVYLLTSMDQRSTINGGLEAFVSALLSSTSGIRLQVLGAMLIIAGAIWMLTQLRFRDPAPVSKSP